MSGPGILKALVSGYQRTLGRLLPPRCRFHPTCSEFALEALELNGALIGSLQATGRVLRCGPWHPGGVDHPRPRGRRAARRAVSHG